MYNFHLTEMVDGLVDAAVVAEDQRSSAREALAAYWADKCALTWTASDVKGQAESMEVELDEEQVKQVLFLILDRHSAEHGVGWDTIADHIREV